MMDAVVPGGVAVDLAPEGVAAIRALVAEARATFPSSCGFTTTRPRCRTARSGPACSSRSRAPFRRGRRRRARLGARFRRAPRPPYPPYDALTFKVPTRKAGDVNARIWVRIAEVGESLDLIEAMLARLPDGPVRAALPGRRAARAKVCAGRGFRGDVFAHVRLADGRNGRPLPSARRLVAAMAAARGGDRGQHRRRLPLVQQVVQRLLLGMRSLGCATRCSRASGPR